MPVKIDVRAGRPDQYSRYSGARIGPRRRFEKRLTNKLLRRLGKALLDDAPRSARQVTNGYLTSELW